MKLYKKKCKNPLCGKEFMGTRTQQYCCPECRISTIPKNSAKEDEEKREPTVVALGEIAKKSDSLGISYGKYVAMQYLKDKGEKNNEYSINHRKANSKTRTKTHK